MTIYRARTLDDFTQYNPGDANNKYEVKKGDVLLFSEGEYLNEKTYDEVAEYKGGYVKLCYQRGGHFYRESFFPESFEIISAFDWNEKTGKITELDLDKLNQKSDKKEMTR